jgi:hypothetical protein
MVLAACAGFKVGQWGLPFQLPSHLTPAFQGYRYYWHRAKAALLFVSRGTGTT